MKYILLFLLISFSAACQNNITVEISPSGAPVMTALPSISGTLTVGSLLTSSTGTWTAIPTSYTYQWKRDGVDISGATSSTYTLTDADAGNKISVAVVAYNASGASRAAISLQSLIPWPAQASISTVFTDNFGRSSPGSNYTIIGSGVNFSQNGSFLRTDRSATGGFADALQLLWPSSTQGFVGEVITMKLRFRVVTQNIGLSIGWKSISGNSATEFTGIFRTAGAGSYVAKYYNQAVINPVSSSLNIANGDQCEIEVARNINTMTVTGRKLDGSGNTVSAQSVVYTYITNNATTLAQNVSQMIIYFHGGIYDLEQLTLTYGLNKYPDIAFCGNSITQWYFASAYTNRYAALAMSGSSKSSVVLAGQGDRTAEILATLDELLMIRPRYAFVLIGTNDIGTGVADATWQANYSSFVNSLISNGIKPILLYLLPRNSYDFRPTTTGSPNKWILDTYGGDDRIIIVDSYTPLKDPVGNGINSAYSSDGLHPNDAGMALLSRTIRNKLQSILGI